MKTFTRFLNEAHPAVFMDYEFGLQISSAAFDSAGRLTTFRARSVIDGKVISDTQWDRFATNVATRLGHANIEKDFRLNPSDKVVFYTEVERSSLTGDYYIDVNGKFMVLPRDFEDVIKRL